jgi:hypothetical protein
MLEQSSLPFPALEQWRAVVGYEGRYEVSDHGRVRSLRRRAYRYDFPRVEPFVLRGAFGGGYLRVQFDRRLRTIHLLVLEAFVGPCPEGCEGSHLNGNSTDNRLANLRWETHVQNVKRRSEHGTEARGDRNGTRLHPERLARGERVANSKLSECDVRAIRLAAAQGEPYKTIAALYRVTPEAVGMIVKRIRWRHVP